jgi:hypothetical protein
MRPSLDAGLNPARDAGGGLTNPQIALTGRIYSFRRQWQVFPRRTKLINELAAAIDRSHRSPRHLPNLALELLKAAIGGYWERTVTVTVLSLRTVMNEGQHSDDETGSLLRDYDDDEIWVARVRPGLCRKDRRLCDQVDPIIGAPFKVRRVSTPVRRPVRALVRGRKGLSSAPHCDSERLGGMT